jgi:hypothetical protein
MKVLDNVERVGSFLPERPFPISRPFGSGDQRQKEGAGLPQVAIRRISEYYGDLLSTEAGWEKARKAGGPWNVVKLPAVVADKKVGEELWKKVERSQKDFDEFQQKKQVILKRLEWSSDLSYLRGVLVNKIIEQPSSAEGQIPKPEELENAKKEVGDRLKEASASSDFQAKVDAQVAGVKSFEELKAVALNLVQEIKPINEFRASLKQLQEIEFVQMDSGLDLILSDVEIIAKRDHKKPEGEDAKKIAEFKAGLEKIKNEKDPEKKVALVAQWVQGSDGIQNYVLKVQIDMELSMAEELRGHADDWDDLKDVGLEIVTIGFHDSDDSALEPYDKYIENLKAAQVAYRKGDMEEAQRLYRANNESPVREFMIRDGQDSAFWYAVTTGALILVVSTVVTMGVSAGFSLAVGAGEAAALVETTALVADGVRVAEAGEALVAGTRVATTAERIGAAGAQVAGAARSWIPVARFLVTSSAFWLSQQGLTDLRDGGFFLWDTDKTILSNLGHIGGTWLENEAFFLVFEGIDKFVLKPGLRYVLAGMATEMAIAKGELSAGGKALTSIFEASSAVQKTYFDLAYKTLGWGSKVAIKAGEGVVEYAGSTPGRW